MASLVQRYNGIYYVVYNDASGKQRWVKGYTDKRETETLAAKLEAEKTAIQRGDLDPIHEHLKLERAKGVRQHVDAYEAHLKAKGLSDNHVDYTIKDIKAVVEFGAAKYPSDITWNLVDQWVNSLRGTPEHPIDAARTINRRVGSVKAFLRHLSEQGILTKYVLHKYPKQKVEGTNVRESRPLTKAETDLLLKKTPADRKLLYKFALRTGFRLSECGAMTPQNLDLAHRTITVRANDAKNKSKDQTIPMHSALFADLKKLVENLQPDQPLFRLPERAADQVREDATAAGIKNTEDVTFHSLRHTYITRLAESNIHPKILQQLARHSDLETTLKYYVHFRQDDERKAIEFA